MDILPSDLHKVILLYLSFHCGRSLNKYYKNLADSIELNNTQPIIITETIIMSYLNLKPKEFSYLKLLKFGYPLNYRYIGFNDGDVKIYYLCNNELCRKNNCYCDPRDICDICNLTYLKLSMSDLEEFYPGLSLINYVINRHPLKDNNQFVFRKQKLTISYYFDLIKKNYCHDNKLLKLTLKKYINNLCQSLDNNYQSNNNLELENYIKSMDFN